MWNSSLWSDILVAVIGAVLAACLTVLIAYRTYRLQERLKEKTVLTNLIHDLHHKRALRAIHPKSVPGAAQSSDYQRTTDSVLEIREWIRTARNSLPPASLAGPTLSTMMVACNLHLSHSDRDPNAYRTCLMMLRKALHAGVIEVCTKVSGLEPLEPGSVNE